MFSNLATYLMGGSTTVPSANAPAPAEVAQGRVLGDQDLLCTEDEDWLLVDSDAQRASTTAQETPSGSEAGTTPISIARPPSQYSGEASYEETEDSSSSPDEYDSECEEDSENWVPSRGLAESWYVAPPACIARRRPIKLATSPLENLLIEHPSMSVYHHSVIEDSPTTVSPAPTIDEEDEDMEVDVMKTSRYTRSRHEQQPHRNNQHSKTKDLTDTATPTVPHFKSQKVNLEVAMLGGRVSHKRDRANRGQLDRLNKCKNTPGNQKLRRSDRQNANKNSYANNNRKCSQRMS